ncbi:hypothetical protein MTBUT4_330007 [Magnetospirillum sp. UT-4]|nr:hypothetical protein MTBUT4_330007 [Magnetospirillum sp. UT-4]
MLGVLHHLPAYLLHALGQAGAALDQGVHVVARHVADVGIDPGRVPHQRAHLIGLAPADVGHLREAALGCPCGGFGRRFGRTPRPLGGLASGFGQLLGAVAIGRRTFPFVLFGSHVPFPLVIAPERFGKCPRAFPVAESGRNGAHSTARGRSGL